jgi:hypothetical protein
VDSKIKEKFQQEYQAGKNAFERGRYRLSVEHLQTAAQLANRFTRAGGETQIWLVTAYQAAGMLPEAIALCKQLCSHPHPEIRQQSKSLLYIIEAPQLNRPPEWMSEIPDLTALPESDSSPISSSTKPKNNSKQTQPHPSQSVDLTQVDTKDNQFIWVALLAALVVLGSLVWFAT